MNRPLIVIFLTVALDAMGIGLIFPVIPDLLHELTGQQEIHNQNGYFLAIYALMQFIFSPILGVLSDYFGRRPVLLISLAGAAVDYIVMGLTGDLTILFLGRAIAGLTGANMAVATSYIADVTEESQRANRYGLMNACFGLGFVAGPLLGGVIGQYSLRNPFFMAAVLNGVTFLLGVFLLPESHKGHARDFRWGQLNPISPLKMVLRLPGIFSLIVVFFIMNMVGQFPATMWAIYGNETFGWDRNMIGYSLAIFGILHAISQAFLTAPLCKRFGEKWAIILSILADGSGMFLLAAASSTLDVLPVMVLLCLGGISVPTLQSLLSKQVEENQQGELQGTLVSLMSLTSVVGPLGVSRVYEWLLPDHGNWVWVVGGGLYLICWPAFLFWNLRSGAATPAGAAVDSAGVSEPQKAVLAMPNAETANLAQTTTAISDAAP